MCDASGFSDGALLFLPSKKNQLMIYYASHTHDFAHGFYITNEKEISSIIFAFNKFHQQLLSSKVVVYTNHATLQILMGKKDVKPSLIRWVLMIQVFNIKSNDKVGTQNQVTNYLSRIQLVEFNENEFPIDEALSHESLVKVVVDKLVGFLIQTTSLAYRIVFEEYNV